ncbi:MAG TPA: DUF1465 family protein [Kiloniellales bacterium]|nr:DUF1465 family protein [Kiloniellales bacterium]
MTDAAPPLAFFNSTFEEAMALTREARDYIAYQQDGDLAGLSAGTKLVASCETMRLTARMTQVVAWLLVQKAVHAGEISRELAAQPKYRLGGQRVCAATDPLIEEPLPERLSDLLARSHALYQRIARLDAMLERRRA